MHPVAREAWSSIHRIYGGCFETPLVPAPWLADAAGAAAVHLKAESQQLSGSYRARGALHRLLGLSAEQLARGVVAAGSLNHGLAVAAAARAAAARAGATVPVRIFVPRSAASRGERLRQQGVQVEEAASEAEAEAAARAAAEQSGSAFVDAVNDDTAAGGLGSIACELLMQLPRGRLDTVLVVSSAALAAALPCLLGLHPSGRALALLPLPPLTQARPALLPCAPTLAADVGRRPGVRRRRRAQGRQPGHQRRGVPPPLRGAAGGRADAAGGERGRAAAGRRGGRGGRG